MKLWMKKISVILITFMTLGMYIPPTYLDAIAAEKDEIVSSKTGLPEEAAVSFLDVNESEPAKDEIDHAHASSDALIEMMTDQAREQTVVKLGPKIYNQVEDEFATNILPTMEIVLNDILADAGEEKIPYYVITEAPSRGYGERIFNIHDYQTKQDVARFHVRRDNRPGEGYWFNFHYHLNKDRFEEHHTIGEIYWDKNTPPKWMS
ncbi:YpjP family protein [Sediminibacillus albus]|uniref:YpjP-like protein n=1 Tax=Sediminibacillus albus TaxID=407036 RepID=A0A1G8WZG2_9BACI|nr:YpjP family protein [Sediminibacillus albus]SDJ82965.1 YpjP-like protein [Sediminibacillus albus]